MGEAKAGTGSDEAIGEVCGPEGTSEPIGGAIGSGNDEAIGEVMAAGAIGRGLEPAPAGPEAGCRVADEAADCAGDDAGIAGADIGIAGADIGIAGADAGAAGVEMGIADAGAAGAGADAVADARADGSASPPTLTMGRSGSSVDVARAATRRAIPSGIDASKRQATPNERERFIMMSREFNSIVIVAPTSPRPARPDGAANVCDAAKHERYASRSPPARSSGRSPLRGDAHAACKCPSPM